MKKLKNFRAIVVIDDFPNRLAERAVVGLLTLGARVLVAIPVGHEDEGRCLFDCWLSGLNAYGRLAMVANQISRESLSRSTIIGADWEGDSLFGSPYRVALVLGVHPRDHSKVVVTFKERMVSGGASHVLLRRSTGRFGRRGD